jgi:hypothetical protein
MHKKTGLSSLQGQEKSCEYRPLFLSFFLSCPKGLIEVGQLSLSLAAAAATWDFLLFPLRVIVRSHKHFSAAQKVTTSIQSDTILSASISR